MAKKIDIANIIQLVKHKENGKKKENVKKLILMITTMISSTHKIFIYTLKIIVKN